jgi:hypothetical protein
VAIKAKPAFRDFSAPSLVKTGHLIALQCGHNGNWSRQEQTLLEAHLVKAGIIPEQ